VFCFGLFLSGVDLKLGGAMASSSDDKKKTPPKDDTKDFRLKEEVESEDEEEDQSSRPNTMIASVGVVTDHDKFKKSAHIGYAASHLSSMDISVRQQSFPYSNT
jgi:hypothetical protein